MNYLTEQTKHALAAEYVIGTMHGMARKRYQRLMVQYPQIREATDQWEAHFNSLGSQLKPIAPDPSVWNKIVQRLDNEIIAKESTNVILLPKNKPNIWKGWSLLATAAAVVLAIILVTPQGDVSKRSEQFTVFQNDDSQSLWLIEIFSESIEVTATINLQQKSNNDYQLWIVPKNGSEPISLGLMPQTGELSLPKSSQFDQLEIAALAVSLEPIGGSPTGLPTEVIYISELALL
jgi:anti-sigma-K factor RskA